MDYTSSPNYVTHYGTGQRMHEAGQALPTVVSDQDMNMVLWSLMEVVKESGLPGIPFSKDSPTSYQRLRDALRALYTPKIEYSSVPTSNKGLMIVVTQPHLRVMVWNGTQYVRAPWHEPCELFFSYDNPATIPGALPVRADVSYQQSNYPDVVDRLGLSGSGTFSLVESRGEFLRVLDNGRGVDAGRVNRAAQSGSKIATSIYGGSYAGNAGRVNAWWSDQIHVSTSGLEEATEQRCDSEATGPLIAKNDNPTLASTSGTPSLSMARLRPRNIAFPLWMTI